MQGGKHPVDLFPFLRDGGILDSLKNALNGVLQSAIDFPFNVPTTGKSGWTSDKNVPFRNIDGEILGVIGTVHDITIRKHRVLQKISYKILHAKTGLEAVDACRNNPDIDLILMDIRLAKMDGYEATRKIRQFNKAVIMIAQTAYGFSGEREKAIEAGCNDFITKPIKHSFLIELISNQYDI